MASSFLVAAAEVVESKISVKDSPLPDGAGADKGGGEIGGSGGSS